MGRERNGAVQAPAAVNVVDDPGRFKPTSHFGKESWREDWLDTSELPAKRTDEHQVLVDKWMNSVGELPD